MGSHIEIHEWAVRVAKAYQLSESEMISVLQKVREEKVFLKMGYVNIHVYCTEGLGLSDAQAFVFRRVAEKALAIPELQKAIGSGELSVSQAKRITSVITPENADSWIDKAKTLSQKKLESEVVKENPKEKVPDRTKPLTEELMEIRGTLSKETEALFNQVKDVLAQKNKKSPSLDETMKALCELFLEKKDPVRKAERNVEKPVPKTVLKSGRAPIPAGVRHRVIHRDQGQCAYRDSANRRCPNRRWLDLHHRTPVNQGGLNTVDNLITLCSEHHRLLHDSQTWHSLRKEVA